MQNFKKSAIFGTLNLWKFYIKYKTSIQTLKEKY